MKLAKHIGEVAGFTMISRILGLVRDMLLFASLGTGMVNSAFIVAFTIPNLFRRLLGEGALTSSSIPVLAEVFGTEGKEAAFSLLNRILLYLLVALALIQIVGLGIYELVSSWDGLEPRWYLGAEYGQWLFPYMVFICLSAIICGMLNVTHRFGLAAFNQVWLNLTMIGALIFGIYATGDLATRGEWVVWGVLIGGVLQLVVPAWALHRLGWRLNWDLKLDDRLMQLFRLFIPSIIGAAIFQVNILISRLLAFAVDETAAGLLYLSSRLIELPLGVFAIAIGTVFFPMLSRDHATGDQERFQKIYQTGFQFIFMITLPAALGLFFLREEIIELIFAWGMFDRGDVLSASPVLAISAIGLPFFAWSGFLVRVYYSRQNMKTPVRLAGLYLVANLVLSLILMNPFGAAGLAGANTLSAIVHCLCLHFCLKGIQLEKGMKDLLVLLLANGLMIGWILLGLVLLQGDFSSAKLLSAVRVGIIVPVAVLIYFSILFIFKHTAVQLLFAKKPL